MVSAKDQALWDGVMVAIFTPSRKTDIEVVSVFDVPARLTISLVVPPLIDRLEFTADSETDVNATPFGVVGAVAEVIDRP